MESRLHFHVAIMKTLHDLTLERLRQGTIYHDTVRAISPIWLAKSAARCDVRFFPKMQIIRWLADARPEDPTPGNKLKRMNGDTKMTFKFGRGENDRNIHMSRTLRATRVIAWYSDTKKLSFAFIPRRIEGHFIPNQRSPLVPIKHSLPLFLLYLPFRLETIC